MKNTFTSENWHVYAQCYDALLHLKPYQEMLTDTVSALAPTSEDKILDAGCGTGNLLCKLSQNNHYSLTGVDFSQVMLGRTEIKCPNDITLMQANLDGELPFASKQFNKISHTNVLYALPRPAYTLKELWRVLEPGGTLVVVNPKKDFDNGLILKAHCESDEPEALWTDAHKSPEREEELLHKALDDTSIVDKMIFVAMHNRHIAQTATFHFLTDLELTKLATEAGFTTVSVQYTYAKQAIMLTLQKGLKP